MTVSVAAPASKSSALGKWRQYTDLPLMVLAFAVIPLLLADLSASADSAVIEWAYTAIWVAFVVDYIVELCLARDRRTYVREEWLALVVNVLTVPVFLIASVPWVFGIQLLRSTRFLRLFRGVRLGAVTIRGANEAVELPRGPNAQLAVGTIVFVTLIFMAAVLEYAVEGSAPAGRTRISNMGDALWWSLGTLTTIGYGDVVPKTFEGRLIAIIPMIAGLSFVGIIAANLASRLFHRLEARVSGLAVTSEEAMLHQVMTRLDALDRRLDRIEASATHHGAGDDGPPSASPPDGNAH